MTDYSKFDKLIEAEEEREKKEKEEERLRLRMKYEKEQKEKQKKWDEKLIAEGKDPVEERKKYGGCAFSHMQHFAKHAPQHDENHAHSHNHNHSHDHKHDHHHHNHSETKPKSSCGYMPIEEIKKLSEERKKEIPLEEKNKKKIAAVYAAKEDGNRLFKEKNYEMAYKVYERGVLIINGMYSLSEKDEDEMENIECLLDLNMALVCLKMKNWTEAINCCKMAIQIDDNNAKAYYRWSEALIGMSEYEEARKQSLKAKEIESKNLAIDRQLTKIDKLQKEQIEKARKEEQKIAQRIRKKMKKQQEM